MGGNSGMLFGSGLFMWIFWILLIIIIIALVKTLTGGSTPPGTTPGETPLDILRKRYARGKIDEQEFERKRRELDH